MPISKFDWLKCKDQFLNNKFQTASSRWWHRSSEHIERFCERKRVRVLNVPNQPTIHDMCIKLISFVFNKMENKSKYLLMLWCLVMGGLLEEVNANQFVRLLQTYIPTISKWSQSNISIKVMFLLCSCSYFVDFLFFFIAFRLSKFIGLSFWNIIKNYLKD